MNTNNMPPLPGPSRMRRDANGYKSVMVYAYHANQMREYGQLCRQQALEEAVKRCRETALPGEQNPSPYRDGYIDGFNRGADQCERAIKDLK